MDNLSRDIVPGRDSVKPLKSIFSLHKSSEKLKAEDGKEDYLYSLSIAKQELDEIERLFNDISDPDLIEYAIYQEYAIKLKLSYLIKKAKEKNIKSMDYTAL